jgi:hypothetical protein
MMMSSTSVAAQVKNVSGYWPPALPDAVETIAASYVQTQANSKVCAHRFFRSFD